MFESCPVGNTLKVSIAGASHAPTLSFHLTGLPTPFKIDCAQLMAFMERRAPGRDKLSTQRHETDEIEFVSGVTPSGDLTGDVICGVIRNRDMRTMDYGTERTIPRPGHADFGQWIESGRIPTGGGANSGRLTAPMCAIGGICLQALSSRNITVHAEIVEVGGKATDFNETIDKARRDGDSVGGLVRCTVTGLAPGLGGAHFAGLESSLAAALFAIPGVKGVSFGNGFEAACLRGSENNDAFTVDSERRILTETNRCGGVLGGRTTGMPLVFTVAFKPTPTIFKAQVSVDLATCKNTVCAMKGRHDPCIVRRAVPVVEALTSFVLLDVILTTEASVPRICLTLTGKTLDEDYAQFVSQRYFTDVVELRVDLLEQAERAKVSSFPVRVDVPVVLTFRRICDGGSFSGDEKERIAFFKQVISASSAKPFAYVDFEEDFQYPELTELATCQKIKIIRSYHDFTGPVLNIVARLRALRGVSFEIPKIAFTPRTFRDVTQMFEDLRNFIDFPHIVCAMGHLGVSSRVLAVRTHSLFTYTSVSGLSSLGHATPQSLVYTYRIRRVTPQAELYGVTGWPLVFTKSPDLHNAAFDSEERDAVMVPIPAETPDQALDFMRCLNLRGLAVTYPHKQTIMPLLDSISSEAQAIGAVNTVVREGSRFVGYNTDADGFAEALCMFLGPQREISSLRAAIIGAGGAARAVAYALKTLGVKACIFNRTLEKGVALARMFGFEHAPLGSESEECLQRWGNVIIQCASPGKDPEHFDPLAFHAFTPQECVYDLVYEPAITPTLARAQSAGCKITNGFSMLVAQAYRQRALWSRAST